MRLPIVGAFVGVAVLLVSCGSQKPCSGSSCIDVSGTFLATYDPELHCAAWAYHPAPSSTMVVTQAGSNVQVLLQPSSESPTHVLSGTLFEGGTITVNEPALDPSLNLPNAALTGNFSTGTSSLVFTGTISFTSPNGTADAGPQGDCSTTNTLNAQRVSSSLTPPDAGATDAGATDAGPTDAG